MSSLFSKMIGVPDIGQVGGRYMLGPIVFDFALAARLFRQGKGGSWSAIFLFDLLTSTIIAGSTGRCGVHTLESFVSTLDDDRLHPSTMHRGTFSIRQLEDGYLCTVSVCDQKQSREDEWASSMGIADRLMKILWTIGFRSQNINSSSHGLLYFYTQPFSTPSIPHNSV